MLPSPPPPSVPTTAAVARDAAAPKVLPSPRRGTGPTRPAKPRSSLPTQDTTVLCQKEGNLSPPLPGPTAATTTAERAPASYS
ncbi:unnamed protein product, partial [Staurois parvus]